MTGKSFEGAHALSGMRILIAEDDWLLADTLAVLLEEQGAHIVGPAPTTAAARRLLAQDGVTFALVDMNLRDSFSDALIDDLRARDIPFAILTAYQSLPSDAEAYAVETLRKPVEYRKLFDLLRQVSGGPAAASN